MEKKLYSKQRLKDYALWYYFRYYPSNARLIQKLEEKGTTDDTQAVFKEIRHLLQEKQIIASKIDNYIFHNKNYRYVRQKMREKLFDTHEVEAYLEKYLSSGKSLLSEDYLKRKIENFIAKGKSRNYIFLKLWETAEDKSILEALLQKYFSQGEHENISKEYEKIISKNPKLLDSWITWRQKIMQKLLAKWFQYGDIKQVLK